MTILAALAYFVAGLSCGMGLFVAASVLGEWLRGKAQREALMPPPRETVFTHMPWRSHTGKREYLQ